MNKHWLHEWRRMIIEGDDRWRRFRGEARDTPGEEVNATALACLNDKPDNNVVGIFDRVEKEQT